MEPVKRLYCVHSDMVISAIGRTPVTIMLVRQIANWLQSQHLFFDYVV